jgi:uncharacterized membrane protein YeaQ/YmgE (transglycosylase-associated protein family)
MSRQRDALLTLATMALLGVVAGVLWSQLADPVVATRTAEGVSSGEVDLAKQVTSDGWFAAIGFVGCLVAGVVLMVWRRRDEVVTLVALVAGAVLAAWLCRQVGTLLGPDPAAQTLANAAVGKTAEDQLQVHTWVVYLTWPFGAVLGSLVVLLGLRGSDRPGAHPMVQ